MINRPRHYLLALLTGILSAGLCSARADNAEMLKEKLFQAKKDYDAQLLKFKKAITDLLDKREENARKKGDKKILDQIKVERDAFEKTGESSQVIPNAIREPMSAARAKLDKAFAATIKELIRLKQDDAAGATEKEQREFQLSSAIMFGKKTYLSSLNPSSVRALESKGYSFEKDTDRFKMNGEVVPHSIFTHPDNNGESSVSYSLQAKYTILRAAVGIPNRTQPVPASPVTFELLGDSKSLWKSEPVTNLDTFQDCTISVDKIKTLTLRVRCQNNGHAHAVWFGPIVIE
jgi:hypothetical protein